MAEAEISQKQGKRDIALDLWLKAIEEIGLPSTYENPWLSLKELRGRLLAGQKLFQSNKDFLASLKLADAFESVFPEDEVVQSKAEAQKAWAENLLTIVGGPNALSAEVMRAEARRRFRLQRLSNTASWLACDSPRGNIRTTCGKVETAFCAGRTT